MFASVVTGVGAPTAELLQIEFGVDTIDVAISSHEDPVVMRVISEN